MYESYQSRPSVYWLSSRLCQGSIHEFEQVLPALAPEAGLHVTQEGQVLLPRVRLGEQVLEGLPQREQNLLVVHWLVAALGRKK